MNKSEGETNIDPVYIFKIDNEIVRNRFQIHINNATEINTQVITRGFINSFKKNQFILVNKSQIQRVVVYGFAETFTKEEMNKLKGNMWELTKY